jgi:hypothetical protein
MYGGGILLYVLEIQSHNPYLGHSRLFLVVLICRVSSPPGVNEIPERSTAHYSSSNRRQMIFEQTVDEIERDTPRSEVDFLVSRCMLGKPLPSVEI